MDTEELHDQLRELAATAAVDASADRGEIESRADLYRRHRRRVASAFTALGIAVVLGVLIVVANSSDGGQSVRVPPAQSSDTATATVPDPIRSVDECLAQLGVARGAQDAGTINVDDLSLGPTTMDLRQLCTEQVALAPPTDAVVFGTYVDGGHVKARYYERVTTTLPDGQAEIGQGRELTPAEVADLFTRTGASTTSATPPAG